MTWDIRIGHEDLEGRIRLIIEAGADVPETVISTLAGSYWEEEILYTEEWEADDFVEFEEDAGPSGGLHG